jgi:hypothetical protein
MRYVISKNGGERKELESGNNKITRREAKVKNVLG